MTTLSRRALPLLLLATSVIPWAAGSVGQTTSNAAAASQDRPPASASGIGLEFIQIQPGVFRMGCSEGDTQCDADENPAHEVRITKTLQMGKHEVTQAQWQAVMGTNRSRFKGRHLRVGVNRADQTAMVESEHRGFLGKLGDLHKGSDSGRLWSWIIDLAGALLTVTSITGIVALALLPARRRAVFLVGAIGIVLSVLLYLVFIPR